MGLGPRIDIRQSQSLVLTPQLTQAIKLLQLSNLELEAFIAEEISKNPLIEAVGGEEEGEAPVAAPVAFEGDSEGDEAPPDPGADELIAALGASDDQPLDIVDRACIIYDGQVLFQGTPQALVADQEVRRLYLGESFAL